MIYNMEKKQCIIMRSGSEFWLSEKKAKEISDILVKQEKHSFIRIAELGGQVINTADVVEICNEQQIDDRNRIKNKETKCSFGKWHSRGEKCECRNEQLKKERQEREEKERAEFLKPRTPEEREKAIKILAENRKILEDKGILTKKVTIEK